MNLIIKSDENMSFTSSAHKSGVYWNSSFAIILKRSDNWEIGLSGQIL